MNSSIHTLSQTSSLAVMTSRITKFRFFEKYMLSFSNSWSTLLKHVSVISENHVVFFDFVILHFSLSITTLVKSWSTQKFKNWSTFYKCCDWQWKGIKNSKIKKLIITDSIDNSNKIKNNNKIEVLSISSLMSEAIKRIANSNSVSDLFN